MTQGVLRNQTDKIILYLISLSNPQELPYPLITGVLGNTSSPRITYMALSMSFLRPGRIRRRNRGFIQYPPLWVLLITKFCRILLYLHKVIVHAFRSHNRLLRLFPIYGERSSWLYTQSFYKPRCNQD